MKVFAAVLLVCLFNFSFSQKQYSKFRKTLNGLTCSDTAQVKHSIENIPQLENWIKNHSKDYGAYYDVAMCYFTLSTSDSLNQGKFAGKCIENNNRYIQLAPSKKKYTGYWNNATIKCWLKDCTGAIEDLNKAKQIFYYNKKWWDSKSEEEIRKRCKSATN